MKSRHHKKPKKFTDIADERIKILFDEAEKAKSQKLANRYVEIARNISMRFKTKIPTALRRRFCKHCNSFLIPGKNLRVRTQSGKVVYTCLSCNEHMRFRTK